MSESVSVCCNDADCVNVFLDQDSSDPVIILVPGLPGPAISGYKTGIVLGVDFSGSPKKNIVIFTTPYVDLNYGILITGTDGRTYTYESKTINGFVINANASAVINGQVSWTASKVGET